MDEDARLFLALSALPIEVINIIQDNSNSQEIIGETVNSYIITKFTAAKQALLNSAILDMIAISHTAYNNKHIATILSTIQVEELLVLQRHKWVGGIATAIIYAAIAIPVISILAYIM